MTCRIAGPDPTNSASYLKFEAPAPGAGTALTFYAVAGRTYTIEFTDEIATATWSRLTNLVARSINHTEHIVDPNSATNRFYRIVTPRRP
jgi:hypothetical protein